MGNHPDETLLVELVFKDFATFKSQCADFPFCGVESESKLGTGNLGHVMELATNDVQSPTDDVRLLRIATKAPTPHETPADLLAASSHRPWPLPSRAWIMSQVWHDLAFFHWPVDIDALRLHVREPLEIDLYENEAWIGVVPFWMSGIRLRGMPPLPFVSRFAELNIRTYVRYRGRPGVLFLTLDAPYAMMNCIARCWFHLPYRKARMSVHWTANGCSFTSERVEHGHPDANFAVDYSPYGQAVDARPGTLDHWLTERYCLFAPHGNGTLMTADITHRPWPLQRACATIHANTMTQGLGIRLPDVPPLVHFSKRIRALIWRPRSCA
ncbi:hypothetical protein B7486_14055 [cyanobacterium TDX16]|nr:hypothetical protein B7486_14055 [cyanobacterium TDX16]